MMTPTQRIRHNLSKTWLRFPKVWLDHRGLTATDRFVASYPRSGSTWLRFVLLETLSGQSSAFGAVNQGIPYVGAHQGAVPLLAQGGRLIKTHEPFRTEYTKAVYLVRDPRDVVLSEYAFEIALGTVNCSLTEFIERFLNGALGYAAWHLHVESWWKAAERQPGNFLLVRFEDLRSNTENEVARIIEFLDCVVERRAIQDAVANNTVDKMRAKEDDNPQKASGPGSRLVRKGAVRGWQGEMTPEQASRIQRVAGPMMERLGYAAKERIAVNGGD